MPYYSLSFAKRLFCVFVGITITMLNSKCMSTAFKVSALLGRTTRLHRGGPFSSSSSSSSSYCSSFCTSSTSKTAIAAVGTKHAPITDPVRVRFAPSPTGSLHVGGARTAVFNWLLARKTNGSFIVRVEDTDLSRSTRESEVSILNDLRWLGLNWDEGPEVEGKYGPYRQSDRKNIYQNAAQTLVNEGLAYPCFCTEEELAVKRAHAEATNKDIRYDGTWRDADPAEVQRRLAAGQPYTLRFKVPRHKTVFIDDIVRGRVTWDTDASLGDFIIMRSNGMPVYNFCVAVDDAHMEITHVIRAEEHLTNTFRQSLILEALHHKPPVYAHCSLILGADKSKLSKRHGAASVQQFSHAGFLPEAMINYLANLGWSNGTPKELYTRDELLQEFDLLRILKSPAVFDMAKLRWVNAQHIRGLPAETVQKLVLEQLTSPARHHSLTLSSARQQQQQQQQSQEEAGATPAVNPEISEDDDVEDTDFNNSNGDGTGTDVNNICIINPDLKSIHTTANTPSSSSAATASASPAPAVPRQGSFKEFLQLCGALSQRDMVTLTDAHSIIDGYLTYDLEGTITSSEEAKNIVSSESGRKVAVTLLQDYASGTMPTGNEDNFVSDGLWKKYVKHLEKVVGLKGKHLYHPIRMFITGSMQGAEVADQLRLLHLSTLSAKCTGEGATDEKWTFINPKYAHRIVSLKSRFAILKELLHRYM